MNSIQIIGIINIILSVIANIYFTIVNENIELSLVFSSLYTLVIGLELIKKE